MQLHQYVEGEWHCTRVTIRIGGRLLSSTTRRSTAGRHRLDDRASAQEHGRSSRPICNCRTDSSRKQIDVTPLIEEDARTGDRGIVMVDTEDPICAAASLFSMEDFLTVALTEPALFHRLLEKLARPSIRRTEQVSEAFPGASLADLRPRVRGRAVSASASIQGVRGAVHRADGAGPSKSTAALPAFTVTAGFGPSWT